MASRDIHDLDLSLQPLAQKFLDLCNAHPVLEANGATVFIDCTFRSGDEQNADYAIGRTQPGRIVTNAQAGQSAHNCTTANGRPAARAFDFAVRKSDGSCDWNPEDNIWQIAIAIGKSLGLVSGDDWHGHLLDAPHFELPQWQGFGPTTGADV